MAIKDLQKDIRTQEGYILSTDTLNLTHLLPNAYDLMVKYNMRTSLKQDIENLFVNTDQDDTKKLLPTFYNQFHGLIKIPDDKQEEASYIWNEDIFNYFNNISPNDYFFGSSEGDGACIGWFKYEEEEF